MTQPAQTTTLQRDANNRWEKVTTTVITSSVLAPAGSYMPDPTCVGVLPNVKRDLHVGDLVIADGEKVANLDVTGWIYPQGSANISNVKGTLASKAQAAKAVLWHPKPGLVTIRDSDLSAPTFDGFSYGMGTSGIDAERVHLHDVIDGFDVFYQAAGIQSRLAASIVDQHLVGPSTETVDHVGHTDGVQVQGDGDFIGEGNLIRTMASPNSPALKDPKLAQYVVGGRANGSNLAITPNTSKITRPVVWRYNWCAGGRRAIGIVANKFGLAKSIVSVYGNLFYGKDTGLDSMTGDTIVTQDASWLEEADNYYCDANGKSTGVRITVKVATP